MMDFQYVFNNLVYKKRLRLSIAKECDINGLGKTTGKFYNRRYLQSARWTKGRTD